MDLIDLCALFLVKGPQAVGQGKITAALWHYFKDRKTGPCEIEVREFLNELLPEYVDTIGRTSDEVLQWNSYTLMSALLLLSEEFPELAEALLYSPLMNQLDNIIDSWPKEVPPFRSYDELLQSFEMFQNAKCFDHHPWLQMVLNVESINYVPLEVYERENAATYAHYSRKHWIVVCGQSFRNAARKHKLKK